MKRNTVTNVISYLLLCAATLALLRFPKEVAGSVSDSLNLCLSTLLPNLFPFFILSSLAIKTGLSQVLGKLCFPIMRPLFRLPGYCATPFILGILGGYPTGAKAVISMYQEGQCTTNEAQRMLAFCVNCGPAFLVGVVGVELFGEIKYGVLLACTHLLASISVGLIINCRYPVPNRGRYKVSTSASKPLVYSFVDSVTGSFHAFLDLCAFVLCFSAVTALLELCGLIDLLANVLPIPPANASALILGFLEMTRGVMSLTLEQLEPSLFIAGGILAWGGLSVHFQVLALLQDTDLSPALYFRGKVLHALFSVMWLWIILQGAKGLYLLTWSALMFLLFKIIKKKWKYPNRYCIMGTEK